MTSSPRNPESARMLYFVLLEPERQAEAIRRLAVMGQSVQTIASATGLAVEAVRRVLDSQQSPASSANIVGADE